MSPEQEFGEGVAAGRVAGSRGVRLENELAARELVAHLVEILPVVFESRSGRCACLDPGQVVDQLQGVVVVGVRTVGAVADGS